MDRFNLLKKTLILLILTPLWVNSFGKGESALQVSFDEATLDLGGMSRTSSLGFSVECISDKNGKPVKLESQCGDFNLSLSSQNNYQLIHNVNHGYSIAYLATITVPGLLSKNEKTYTSQIDIQPAYFPESQPAGTYTDSLTLTVSDDN